MKTFLQQLCKALWGCRGNALMPAYKGREDGLHELTEDYNIALTVLGISLNITVKKGFIFDGASVPRFLWTFIGHPMTPPRVAAALVHDWLHKSQVVPKWLTDIIYASVQVLTGIRYHRITLEYVALVLFSSRYWAENAKGDIELARRFGRIDFVANKPHLTTTESEKKEHE